MLVFLYSRSDDKHFQVLEQGLILVDIVDSEYAEIYTIAHDGLYLRCPATDFRRRLDKLYGGLCAPSGTSDRCWRSAGKPWRKPKLVGIPVFGA